MKKRMMGILLGGIMGMIVSLLTASQVFAEAKGTLIINEAKIEIELILPVSDVLRAKDDESSEKEKEIRGISSRLKEIELVKAYKKQGVLRRNVKINLEQHKNSLKLEEQSDGHDHSGCDHPHEETSEVIKIIQGYSFPKNNKINTIEIDLFQPFLLLKKMGLIVITKEKQASYTLYKDKQRININGQY
ncbi:MAG: DUF2796 domain-containing protein [bacterium]